MARLCSIESCGNKHDSNGYCGKHNMMWKRHGDPLYVPVHVTKLCSIKDCSGKHNGKGFCVKHHYRFKKYGDPLYVPDPEQTKKKQSDSQKEWLEKNVNPMTGRKQSDKTKKKISVSKQGKPSWNKGTKGIMKPNSGSFKKGQGKGVKKSKEYIEKVWTKERREKYREILRQTRKNVARPNKPEKAIGKILSSLDIKFKFLQNVSYSTLDNKSASKEMDIVWKDSRGNKKIIEYNGRFHFDPREHKPDEIHTVHSKPTKCQDIWDKEKMILKQIRKEGYKILVIWQLDWLSGFDKTTKKILNFVRS